ncbi:MAG: LptF/LptG family permease [Holosporaceae bacterium]|jgi:lipopolysaccharide export system permease protein|nr:LptF/LptG family permease [Holosporaceae bacterium]
MLSRLASAMFWRIFRATVYFAVALVFCAWVVQSSRYLVLLSSGGVSLARFLRFTSYLSLDIVALVLPIALAVSAALVYRRFMESGQLIALQAAGISPRKMLSPLLVLATIVTGYLYVSNVYFSPVAWKKFRSLEFKIRNHIDPPESAGSIFSNDGFSVYAQEYLGDFYFRNIFIVDTRNPEKTYSYYADTGTIRNNILMLAHGERIEVDFRERRNSVVKFQFYNYDLREILKVESRPAQPNEKFIHQLLQDNGDNPEMTMAQRALFHQKTISPLLAVVFPLLAFLLTILAPHERRQTFWRISILLAVIMSLQGIFFWIANAGAKNLKLVSLNYALVIGLLLLLTLLIWWKCKKS